MNDRTNVLESNDLAPGAAQWPLTDDALMSAIKSVCDFDTGRAEKWRPEALAIGRAVERAVLAALSDAAQAPQRTYTTQPGESVMGIALRECGNELVWHHILACNPEFARLLPHEYFPVGTVLTLPPQDAAPVAPAAVAPSAEIAGLESAIGYLSALVEAQRKLLVDVNEICGVDGHGGTLEDGESEIIDRVRSHLAILSDDHSGEADSLQCHSEGA